ncbi:hypothetical protein F4780DRAFT_777542 [Xylariomycetidae sp. FL0641]|nr:hypothetical protein F4780DRAFT_777542 [Xylariomycetidae sp. FL0641]
MRGTKRQHPDDAASSATTQRRRTTTKEKTADDKSSETAPAGPIGALAFGTSTGNAKDEDYYTSLYATELDFRLLGTRDPAFAAVLDNHSQLDFSDPTAVMQLTKTLLKLHFGLQIVLPQDRLCPPVPNRHNYILWLKNLLDSTSPSFRDQPEPERRLTGLDIGTGASLIYPLLGCAQRSWSFIATDIDANSLDYARKNAELNKLGTRVRILERKPEQLLIPLDECGVDSIDFVMSNPPFYVSEQELLDLAQRKARPPNSACTGAPVEMVCAEGEVGFVQRMIAESLTLKARVQWYTSMVGKQSSLQPLVDTLRSHAISNYAITSFVQGNKTRRWAIGWSFGDRRASNRASRGFEPPTGKKLLPPPTEMTMLSKNSDLARLSQTVCDTMEAHDLVSWSWDGQRARGIGFSAGNVWSRAYRRKKARETADSLAQKPSGQSLAIGRPTFGFAVSVREERQQDHDVIAVTLRWLQGDDYTLFESFAGVLRNAVHPRQQG